jgi:hypothetical protein
VHPGDDVGLLDFACAFAPIAARFAHGRDLVVAATRIVAERGGPLCRQAALACIEALQHRQHAEARNLAEPATPGRLRHFVLAARLCADLWLRFVPSADSGRPLPSRLADVTETRPSAPQQPAPAPAPLPHGAPGVCVLQPFEPPNDRAEWQAYQPLSSPMPLRAVPRDAGRRLAALAEAAPAFAAPSPRSAAPWRWRRTPGGLRRGCGRSCWSARRASARPGSRGAWRRRWTCPSPG